jgi:LacI family transcriptional regulator, xylobiose transport system transcriptional regulator
VTATGSGATAAGAAGPGATAAGPAAAGGRRGRLTVVDIARLAGVSAPTVSRVLNGHAGVAPDTRHRVEEVLREHHYQLPPNEPAPLLELTFHALDSLWALEIIRGVEAAARRHDLAVVLTEMQGRLTPGRGWAEQVLTRRPTGVVSVLSALTGQQQHRLAVRSIPLVVLDPTGEPLHETPSVGATNYTGSLVATRHLLGLGHRRIAMLAGNQRWPFCRARLDGFRAAMDGAGAPVDPALVRVGALYVPDAVADATALLRLPDPPTAVLTTNDLQALGVYEAARRAGVAIPGELSVVGFDDLPFSRWTGPAMTTVRQPLEAMGSAAAELVIGLAAGRSPERQRIELSTELVVRESTAPPARR